LVRGNEFAWDQPRGVAALRSERHISSRSTKGTKSTRRASAVSKLRTCTRGAGGTGNYGITRGEAPFGFQSDGRVGITYELDA
jgi:hypothetical protein